MSFAFSRRRTLWPAGRPQLDRTIEYMLGEVSTGLAMFLPNDELGVRRREVVRILQAQSVAGISLERKDLV